MSEEEYRQHVNKMNENIGNILKDYDEELMFYVNLVKRFNDICEENDKKEKVINKAIETLEKGIKFCENDSQGIYDNCNIAINREKKVLDILKEGKNEYRNY